MVGHAGQNDTDFTLLQDEVNAAISRPLWPNFAIAPIFDQLWGTTGSKRLGGTGEKEVGIDRRI